MLTIRGAAEPGPMSIHSNYAEYFRDGRAAMICSTGTIEIGIDPSEFNEIDVTRFTKLLVPKWRPSAHALQTPAAVPEEVSTEEAAQILGCSKDTVLKFKNEGLLEHRNAAPPSSSRPVFRFPMRSVLQLRCGYEKTERAQRAPKESPRRKTQRAREYKHLEPED
jgi:hypothetical protein